jgi:predicted lipase
MQPSERNYVQAIIDDLKSLLMGSPEEEVRMYALVVMNEGLNSTLEHVHNAWATYRATNGHSYIDAIPFNQLSTDVQEINATALDAVHTVARAYLGYLGKH